MCPARRSARPCRTTTREGSCGQDAPMSPWTSPSWEAGSPGRRSPPCWPATATRYSCWSARRATATRSAGSSSAAGAWPRCSHWTWRSRSSTRAGTTSRRAVMYDEVIDPVDRRGERGPAGPPAARRPRLPGHRAPAGLRGAGGCRRRGGGDRGARRRRRRGGARRAADPALRARRPGHDGVRRPRGRRRRADVERPPPARDRRCTRPGPARMAGRHARRRARRRGPTDQMSLGTEGDLYYLVFPRAHGRVAPLPAARHRPARPVRRAGPARDVPRRVPVPLPARRRDLPGGPPGRAVRVLPDERHLDRRPVRARRRADRRRRGLERPDHRAGPVDRAARRADGGGRRPRRPGPRRSRPSPPTCRSGASGCGGCGSRRRSRRPSSPPSPRPVPPAAKAFNAAFRADPVLGGPRMAAQLGPDNVPAEAFGPENVARILAMG